MQPARRGRLGSGARDGRRSSACRGPRSSGARGRFVGGARQCPLVASASACLRCRRHL